MICDIVLDARTEEEGTGRRREQCSDLGLASDQIPGQNNIGYGPYYLWLHHQAPAMKCLYGNTSKPK